MSVEKVEITPTAYWGKRPLYSAKVGTGASNLVVIYRIRKFHINQKIKFCIESDVRGMRSEASLPWCSGRIYDIRGERLFIERF